MKNIKWLNEVGFGNLVNMLLQIQTQVMIITCHHHDLSPTRQEIRDSPCRERRALPGIDQVICASGLLRLFVTRDDVDRTDHFSGGHFVRVAADKPLV